jgi:uncharacterized protein involved in exopolysaccharide biosynthesis
MTPITAATSVKLGAAAAILGAIAAGAISFTLPRRYVSTAVMRFTPGTVAGKPAWQVEAEATRRLVEMQGEILGRASLTEIIQRPTMDLYRQERATYPMEDVIQDMRNRDLHMERVTPTAFRVSFEYPDRVKAQAVVRELTTRFGAGGIAEVLTPASLPEKPNQPDRLAIVAIGLGVGLALGILGAFLRRCGLKWTLGMAGCTATGCVFAAVICLLMPDTFADDQKSIQFLALGAFTGLVAGAFLLRNRTTAGNHYARLIAFSAAFGAIAGGFVSFSLPEHYVSTATMRAIPFPGDGPGAAPGETEYAERLQWLTENILSRSSMAELIERPSLDLYRTERQRHPLEDIINDMRRRDIRIAPTPPSGLSGLRDLGPVTNFQISFEYPDSDKAQAVVRELVTRYTEGNVIANRDLAGVRPDRDLPRDERAGSPPFGIAAGAKPDSDLIPGVSWLEVLDLASVPASPVSPNRPAAAAIGLLAGLLVGSLLALRRWLAARQAATPGPHPSYWKYTFAAAAIGAIAFGLGSIVILDRYVSTAVLRVVPFPAGGARTAQGEIEYAARLRQLTQDILSRGSLAELIQRPSLDLYRRERRADPLEDIIDDMRNRDIRIAPTRPFGLVAGPGHLTSFEISFEYPDRYKAQAVVRELVTKFTEGNAAAERALHRDGMPGSLALEVLDPASDRGYPVSPDRPAAAAIGLLAGMLLGPFLAWRRQQRANRHAAVLGPRPSYWKYALPAAILGWTFASYAALQIPNRYVSTAVLRLVSADPRSPVSVQAAAEHMPEMFRPVLSRDSLAEIILRPKLQLYATELYAPQRKRRSLDEVVKQMRERDLHVEPLRDSPFGGHPTAFRISFEYSNPVKARACVQAVVSKFVEAALPPQKNGALRHAPSDGHGRLLFSDTADPFVNPYVPQRDAADLLDNKLVEGGGDGPRMRGAPYLEVLDPADVYAPDRIARWGTLGGLAGLLLGIAIARARWITVRQAATPGPHTPYWKYALTGAAWGLVLAGVGSIAIPEERYVSTAVVRLAGTKGQASAARIQEIVQQVRSRESLVEIIERPSLQLYSQAWARHALDDVVKQMRDRDLHVDPLPATPPGGTPTAIRISFESFDPRKAQACVQALVDKLASHNDHTPSDLLAGTAASPFAGKPVEPSGYVPWEPGRPYLEVLAPASVPETPASPNRFAIMGTGCLAGLLLGPVYARLRRRAPHSAPA